MTGLNAASQVTMNEVNLIEMLCSASEESSTEYSRI
jgi:hypothetical protein